jgi:hypothetical protein
MRNQLSTCWIYVRLCDLYETVEEAVREFSPRVDGDTTGTSYKTGIALSRIADDLNRLQQEHLCECRNCMVQVEHLYNVFSATRYVPRKAKRKSPDSGR